MSEPIDGLLSDVSRCRRFTPDVSVHWFPSPAVRVCHCGEIDDRPAARAGSDTTEETPR